MTRIRPDLLILCLALLGGYLAFAAPRAAHQPADSSVVIPAAIGTPPVSEMPRETASGTPADVLLGVPRPNRTSSGRASAVPTPVTRPRPTMLPSKVAVAPRATPRPRPVVTSHAAPTTKSVSISRRLVGPMSWYCWPGRSACTAGIPTDCNCAAAGPALRAALGAWRGRTVLVNGIETALIDTCQCPDGRLLDGYAALWQTLGLDTSRGVVDVRVTW